jgi:hypothetical protein
MESLEVIAKAQQEQVELLRKQALHYESYYKQALDASKRQKRLLVFFLIAVVIMVSFAGVTPSLYKEMQSKHTFSTVTDKFLCQSALIKDEGAVTGYAWGYDKASVFEVQRRGLSIDSCLQILALQKQLPNTETEGRDCKKGQ